MEQQQTAEITQAKYSDGAWQTLPAELPQEQMMTLYINGLELVSLLCTPEKLNALVIGFLRSEGFITNLKEVQMARVCIDDSLFEVRLNKEVKMPERRTITSGCGGGSAFDTTNLPKLESNWSVTPVQITHAMKHLQVPSADGNIRRGLHVSALSDGEKLISRAEDIGRHNTLDKIWGECMLTNTPTADRLLLTTGRISSEMVTKAARMGTPIVASINSATQKAVQLGEAAGITVIGYVRGQQFSVYSHPERIVGFSASTKED